MIQYPKADHMIKQLKRKELEIEIYLNAYPELDHATMTKLKIRIETIQELILQLQRKPEDAHLIEHFRFD